MRRTLLALVVLLVPFAAVSSAQANGFTDITCTSVGIKQVDPLKNYSATDPNNPSHHRHNFFCNKGAMSASATVESMLAADTTAEVPSDGSAIWLPCGVNPATGECVEAISISERLINDADPNESDTVIPPDGLAYIWGNGVGNTATSFTGVKPWQCRGGTSQPESYTIPTSCPPGTTNVELVTYNGSGCFDLSKGLGQGLGRDTPPQTFITGATGLDCPAPYTKLPRWSVIVQFPTTLIGGWLDSDDKDRDGAPDVNHGSTIHIDFVYLNFHDGQDRGFYEQTTPLCFNQPPTGGGSPLCRKNPIAPLGGPYDPTRPFQQVFGERQVVLDNGRTYPPSDEPPPPPPPVPESAVTLYACDYNTATAHLYKATVGCPLGATQVASPARMEPMPCDGDGEKLLVRYGKAGKMDYTDDDAEKAQLAADGWIGPINILCTVPAGTPASVPFYKVTMPDGDRHLVTSESEKATLVGQGGIVRQYGNVYPPEAAS